MSIKDKLNGLFGTYTTNKGKVRRGTDDLLNGIVFGLIFAFVYIGIFGGFFCTGKLCGSDTSLALDYQNGNVPYGVLWTWLNPFYWTQQPYMVLVTAITGAMYVFQYFLVRKNKLNKWLVFLNFFSTVFFNATHVYQEGTKVMFGPLVSISPLFLIPMILQIFPLGWSWNFQDPHWQCGVNGQCISFVNGRLDIVRSDFITHLAFVFWIVVPLMFWWKKRTGNYPFLKQFEWMDRHWKIMLIPFVTFMLFLTFFAWWHNGSFFCYAEGAC